MTLSQIQNARDRIKPYAIQTPLIQLQRLKDELGFIPSLKLENLQNMGAFKIRGAMNAALQLSEADLRGGLMTASSGNHGRAVALAAKMLGVPATIVLPDTVSQLKRQAIEKLGARTILVEPQQRIPIGLALAKEEGYHFIHPYDDEDVIAGQGTIGLEILEQYPEVRTVFVPMGGGGLISGISLAMKSLRPDVIVIGLEPAAVPKFSQNLMHADPLPVTAHPSLADALMSNTPGRLPLQMVRQHVDRIISVQEPHLKEAFRLLLEEGRIWAEPSSAIGLGAVLQEKMDPQDLVNSVFVISGGNISSSDALAILK